MTERITKSKERVKKYGEVYTPAHIVKNMCDMLAENNLPDDAFGIEKTFLEPCCGTGNFLVEIYARKLERCENVKDGLKALASIVGIDILQDNVETSRERLEKLFLDKFPETNEIARETAKNILKNNIFQGDSLEIMKKWQSTEQK